jgi:hypothetical protein
MLTEVCRRKPSKPSQANQSTQQLQAPKKLVCSDTCHVSHSFVKQAKKSVMTREATHKIKNFYLKPDDHLPWYHQVNCFVSYLGLYVMKPLDECP